MSSVQRRRSAIHAALGDPARLAIVDALDCCDRAPTELQQIAGVSSSLLAHHLDVLEDAGLISRHRSHGDGRRRYVRLEHAVLDGLTTRPAPTRRCADALFVCSHGSARSPLAAAIWRRVTGAAASSAGTRPAPRVHPGAVAAADRADLDLTDVTPRQLPRRLPGLVVTVCDQVREELRPSNDWVHWSLDDPVAAGTAAAFDTARDELTARITRLAGAPR